MTRPMTLTVALLAALPVLAKIEMGAPFSDHAVLQRDMQLPVWGKADPGATVKVTFAEQEKTAVADVSGRWRVTLDPLPASKEPRDMVVTSNSQTPTPSNPQTLIKDLLVGEVWFASGQSNMDCPIWGGNPRYRDANGALVLAMTRLPHVRYCKNAQRWSVKPLELTSTWRTLTPENVRAFPLSAIGFYYVRELYLALDVPVGIVDASWGGTNIDAWTPRCGYADCDPALRETADYVPVENGTFPLGWTHEWDWSAPINKPYQQPTVIWNGMVDAWCPMAMRGVIWYQGCHNNGQAPSYCERMHALYNGWSRAFENPRLSFRFAQLAPYYHNWMGIVQAQARFAAEEPNASMVATADVGNFDDVHPNRKEIVAKRLAAQALRRDYGFDIPEADPPALRSAKFDGAKAELSFDHVKSWYVYSPDKSVDAAFELAGADGVWHPAKIENLNAFVVEGPALVLASEEVAEPVRARYMGRNRTMGTLYNEMSLPLGPFETK